MPDMRRLWSLTLRSALVVIPALGLAGGLALMAAGQGGPARLVFGLATLPVVAALLFQIAISLRRGDTGLDIVAALSMGGALALGETLAGVVVALMYAGGQYLEAFAERRAMREMTALLERVPRSAMRYGEGGLAEVPIAQVVPGDLLLVRHGELVPVDGTVRAGHALLDLAALTGESVPLTRGPAGEVPSGAVNAGAPFDLVAVRPAAQSTYAGIVRLVEAAREAKAPMGRLADRYAVVFLAVTLVLAGGAWLATGDPVRALAVLVTATPCPLILAVPVALIAGVSRAARRGVLVKGGAALEALARLRVAVVDKTGTLTVGRAGLVALDTLGNLPADDVLRLAASLDQASSHVVAQALVDAAHARGLALANPSDVLETPGEGVEGLVEGRRVRVGGVAYVRAALGGVDFEGPAARPPGTLRVAVAVDGRPAGLLLLEDALREEAAGALDAWRRAGVERIVLASGDRPDVAERIGARLGVDEVRAGLKPQDKVAIVAAERARGPVMMLGDGVNDAPALKRAEVGVAMGRKGTEAAREAADVVLADDNFASIASAVREGRAVYDNLKKFILFMLPTNGGEALVVIAALFLGLGLPLTPAQVLWINMVTSSTLGLALAFEPAERDIMRRRPRPPGNALLSGFFVWRVLMVALLMMLGAFGLFLWELQRGTGIESARTMAVNAVVIGEMFYLINSRSIFGSVLNRQGLFGNRWVLLAIAACIPLQLAFTYAPWMQEIFGSRGLSPAEWLRALGAGLLVFLGAELEKWVIRRSGLAQRLARH